jgi:hypothetical protein
VVGFEVVLGDYGLDRINFPLGWRVSKVLDSIGQAYVEMDKFAPVHRNDVGGLPKSNIFPVRPTHGC